MFVFVKKTLFSKCKASHALNSDNNREIGRKHGLHEKVVRNWRRDEMKIRDALSKGKMYHAGNAGRPPSGNAGRPPKQKDFTIHKWDWK